MGEFSKELDKIDIPENSGMFKAKEHHITLIFYRDLPEEDVPKLKTKFNGFSFPKFDIEGEEIIVSPSKIEPQIYSLSFKDNSKLNELRDLIMKRAGFEGEEIFNFHLTLLRKEKLIRNFEKTKEKYSEIKPLKMNVNSFGLYKSEPSKGLNSYSPIFVVKLKK